jgi:hypothetical protein
MCWHSNAYFSLFSSLFFFDPPNRFVQIPQDLSLSFDPVGFAIFATFVAGAECVREPANVAAPLSSDMNSRRFSSPNCIRCPLAKWQHNGSASIESGARRSAGYLPGQAPLWVVSRGSPVQTAMRNPTGLS